VCLGGRDQAGALGVGHQPAELASFARWVLEPLPDRGGGELGQLPRQALDDPDRRAKPSGVEFTVAGRDRLPADRWAQPGVPAARDRR
jgi:hypothetical protein